ncbi:hypothetical protein PDJAM_G00215690 [Pangasius djambal]|uniref:Uncharacterized protein n=1 Tax=Pangasius djambal TaxID=1691987 RepID=A0ACC5YAU5_9TELE|nr:hypothetical protein [Pangasius djambal]
MPTPEQNPVSEEGLLLPIKGQLANHNMESESTANNILASVKEQEECPPLSRTLCRRKAFCCQSKVN